MPSGCQAHRYDELRQLLQAFGGTMIYSPGGGPGGTWTLCLAGKKLEVEVRSRQVNALDRLYVAEVADPQSWDDYRPDAPLVEDIRARLAVLFSPCQDGDLLPQARITGF